MPETKHNTSPARYASTGDFHRIFDEEKDNLYRLSFLLTTDHDKAQQCFVSGLEDSVKGNSVFKEWARSWARRVIIQNAVRVVKPRPIEEYAPPSFNSTRETPAVDEAELDLADILDLGPFERFVFVMLVLEHYSEHECSILLGCSRRDVIAARSRALQQIRSAMGSNLERHVRINSKGPGLTDNWCSALEDLLHI
jgi:DNA-directed RNA polymerase specialized sigma24 family protein